MSKNGAISSSYDVTLQVMYTLVTYWLSSFEILMMAKDKAVICVELFYCICVLYLMKMKFFL